VAAGDLCSIIEQYPIWKEEFSKGKMLGILVVKKAEAIKETDKSYIHYLNNEYDYIAAFSGLVNIRHDDFFVPAIYNLDNPGDFYRQGEKKITEINEEIKKLETNEKVYKHKISELKRQRKEMSLALQIEIFKHFNFTNTNGETKNIMDIFTDAKRSLPPGGAGECAAPRLFQFAYTHGLEPVSMAEFWYGVTPRREIRLHKEFYPSCIEKCSPILNFQLGKNAEPNSEECSNEVPNIVYDDDSIVVVNKPAGVLSTPAKDTSLFNVEDWLHKQYPEVKGPMLVHRLDQSTSGLMLAAKNADTFKTLQQGFLDGTIQKRYIALLNGNVPSECGVINLPICPNPDDRPRQTVDRQFGKNSMTRYEVLERKEGKTLVAFYPITGRTHQIRLHCASPFGLDIPIVGDKIYTVAPFGLEDCRLMLHAERLSFIHPKTKKGYSLEQPYSLSY